MNTHPELPNIAAELTDLIEHNDTLPPISSWQPGRIAEIDIEIDAQGQWFYQGEPMVRGAVVRLLSRIMLKEGDDYFLVSPSEKLKIRVADVPFVVRLMSVEGQGDEQILHFSTNVGDHFSVGAEHPLRISQRTNGDTVPYVRVRAGLDAKLLRSVYYELAEYAQASPEGDGYVVYSQGQAFKLG